MTLAVSNIAKSFGDNKVLVDVSFELHAGQIAILMGANGSGKTTLFNIISGFLKQDRGLVSVNEKNVNNIPAYKINRLGITRTFQDMRLIGNLTVKQNLMLAFPQQEGEKWWKTLLQNKGIKREQEENSHKADEILKTCFIDNVTDSKASEISYGQQKLLNLACCMANEPQYLLLDEPVAGVNMAYREKLTQVIRKLKAENKALLIIEHNTDFIQAVADRIFFLNNGWITEFENYETLKQNTQVQNAYI
ncbi:MAG TPA: ATP-binding cassette domain-containing protein [Salinivirgaceae bacterium]|nr:ATP-binding cassette domain-containing protein [Salinivirgaceae bacterium]